MRAMLVVLLLSGCATPIVDTQVIERPVPVFCSISVPSECRSDYAVDRLAPGANDAAVNRALRAEVEERAACEVKLRAAIMGCNSKPK